MPLTHSCTSVYPQGNLLCIILRELSINSPVFILFIPLFVKTDARHQIVAPPSSPAAMARHCALASAPSRLRARFFPYLISTWCIWEWGAPGENSTKFVKEEGVALQNHVIKTVTASAPIKCRWDCVDIPLCFSINVRKLQTGRVTCELNNSSKTADPQDLISSPESQYHQMAVSRSLLISKYQFSLVITMKSMDLL